MASSADPMQPRLARVIRRRRDAPDVYTLDIAPDDGEPTTFLPGQFNMLSVLGVGEVPISFSGDPRSRRLVHTVRAVGAVSTALVKLTPGSALGLRGPFGIGWPLDACAGRDVIVIAGGLGLAPLRPALCRLVADRERYGKVTLLCGARGPEGILFRREFERWRRTIDVELTVDHATTAWQGRVGVVTKLLPLAKFDPKHAVALVCGPEIMMRFAIAALRAAGLSDEAIYLSMERNMKCAVGFCGHCQFGTVLVCRDGPVFRYDRVRDMLALKEI